MNCPTDSEREALREARDERPVSPFVDPEEGVMAEKHDAEALATAADYYGLPLGVDDDCLRKSLAYSQALLRLHSKDLVAPAVRLAESLVAALKRWVDRDKESTDG